METKTRHTVSRGVVTTFAESFKGRVPQGRFIITVSQGSLVIAKCEIQHPDELDEFKTMLWQAQEQFKRMR